MSIIAGGGLIYLTLINGSTTTNLTVYTPIKAIVKDGTAIVSSTYTSLYSEPATPITINGNLYITKITLNDYTFTGFSNKLTGGFELAYMYDSKAHNIFDILYTDSSSNIYVCKRGATSSIDTNKQSFSCQYVYFSIINAVMKY